LVGWSKENGTEYWIMRNSWGTYWGEHGFMRIELGKDIDAIEEDCDWGVPIIPEGFNPLADITDDNKVAPGTYHNYNSPVLRANRHRRFNKIARELSAAKIEGSIDLPTNYDPRNISGVDWTTQSKNQHSPATCFAGWAFAATSAINDRIKLLRNRAFPDINISPQVLLNCASNSTDGCVSGEAADAFEYMQSVGATDDTCENYEAVAAKDCSPINVCRTCTPEGDCSAVNTYRSYKVSSIIAVNGESAMVKEIATNGPIVCDIAVTPDFESYKNGIFMDQSNAFAVAGATHQVAVSGFGVDEETKQKYWIVRNSWGTMWGNQGWFKIIRGANNLGIESNCLAATPVAASWQ